MLPRPQVELSSVSVNETERLFALLEEAGKIPAGPKRFNKNQMWGANSALGNWAERMVGNALNDAGLPTIKYGASEQGELTDALRKAFMQEFLEIGKRPDLLAGSQLIGLEPRNAYFGLEIRSSMRDSNDAYFAANGKPLSFTVKAEDLAPHCRWVMSQGVPLLLAQVFMRPEAYVISWNSVLQACLEMKPETHQRSGKSTYNIPLDHAMAVRLGVATTEEKWESELLKDNSGKYQPVVCPANVGRLSIDARAYRQMLANAELLPND